MLFGPMKRGQASLAAVAEAGQAPLQLRLSPGRCTHACPLFFQSFRGLMRVPHSMSDLPMPVLGRLG